MVIYNPVQQFPNTAFPKPTKCLADALLPRANQTSAANTNTVQSNKTLSKICDVSKKHLARAEFTSSSNRSSSSSRLAGVLTLREH